MPPGWQIVVERLPAGSGILPIRFMPLQSVPEAYFLWRYQTQRGVADLQVAGVRWQPQVGRSAKLLAIGYDPLDLHGRREGVVRQAVRIDHLHCTLVGEPQTSVDRARRRLERNLSGLPTVERIENPGMNRDVGVTPPLIHLLGSEREQTARRREPDRRVIILDDRIDAIAWETIPDSHESSRPLVPAQQSECRGRQHGAIVSYVELRDRGGISRC